MLLVIGSDDHDPAAVHAAQALDDAGAAELVVIGVVDGVQRAPGAGLHQQIDTLHGGHLAFCVHIGVGLTGGQGSAGDLVDLGFDLLQFCLVLGVGTHGLIDSGHLLEIARHRIVTHRY